MNKHLLTIALALSGASLLAQDKQISLGADLGLPLDPLSEEYSFLVGPTAGFELPVGTNLGITLQVSYILPQAKSEFADELSSSSLIPAQLGLKYYFQEQQKGFYGHAQVGIHSFTEKFKEIDLPGVHFDARSETQTNLSWAIGVGYQLDKFDIGLRYNAIVPSEDAEEEGEEGDSKAYIGLRVAYLFALGN